VTIQFEFVDDEVIDATKGFVEGHSTDTTRRVDKGEIFTMYLLKERTMFHVEFADKYLNRLGK
jgi:hypothetical protein